MRCDSHAGVMPPRPREHETHVFWKLEVSRGRQMPSDRCGQRLDCRQEGWDEVELQSPKPDGGYATRFEMSLIGKVPPSDKCPGTPMQLPLSTLANEGGLFALAHPPFAIISDLTLHRQPSCCPVPACDERTVESRSFSLRKALSTHRRNLLGRFGNSCLAFSTGLKPRS